MRDSYDYELFKMNEWHDEKSELKHFYVAYCQYYSQRSGITKLYN